MNERVAFSIERKQSTTSILNEIQYGLQRYKDVTARDANTLWCKENQLQYFSNLLSGMDINILSGIMPENNYHIGFSTTIGVKPVPKEQTPTSTITTQNKKKKKSTPKSTAIKSRKSTRTKKRS